MTYNLILDSDSYKYSMHKQYPEGTEVVYSYIESRGGKWDDTLFFGLQAYLKEYLSKPITQDNIDEAEAIITAHGEPFNREGWEYILREHGGYLPVRICAVPEGTVVPVKNVLLTIENTDTRCFWLTTFLETALLRAVWYPTSVATNSMTSKKIIRKWLEKTGDPDTIDFRLHDFGARGVSSLESASLGGMAHLLNFGGSDTVSALVAARKYYGADIAGFSVPAMEHSTVTSWGRENELDSYRNMLKQYAGGVVSIVSDSYNIFEACRAFGTVLKQDVLDNRVKLVVRPDSGDPASIVTRCLDILGEGFGSTVNDKGYRVLNHGVKVLQGDGITGETIEQILQTATSKGWSADSILFGQGGQLLQGVTRDTQRWAMKCSAIRVNGEWRRVFKDPITDQGKSSKSGRVTLYQDRLGKFSSGVEDWPQSALVPVFENGRILKEWTWDEIRNRAK